MPLQASAIPLKVKVQGVGYPILCLHGHPGLGASMSVFTDHLSQRFQTLAPDLRGYGSSRTQQDFVMAAHLTDLEALLDRFQIRQCLVLGWSLGGILAMELALKLPQRISGLALIATAACPRGSHPPISWQDNFYTGIASIVNWVQPGAQWHIEMFKQRSLYRYLLQQHTTPAYHRLANEGITAYLQTSGQANRALQVAMKGRYNRLPELKQIKCPCLMLAGEADRHITAASSQETCDHLPNCQWQHYLNVAHLFPWEISEQVLADIDSWMAAHPEAIGKGEKKIGRGGR